MTASGASAPAESVALVTGGASGLGAAIVRRLHAGGHRVAIVDLDVETGGRLAAELDASGRTARAYETDVSDRAALVELLGQVLGDLGGLHVVVNNAARTRATPLMAIEPDELESVLRVNLGGTFFACQVFGAHLAEQGYGRIVNLASLAGQNGGTATGGHYASSKGAVISATKVFARELASSGVTVNAVSPGPLDSPMVRSVVGEDDLAGFTDNIPVGRLGSMSFIGEMVALLSSPEAAFVTGATWDANGGLYVR